MDMENFQVDVVAPCGTAPFPAIPPEFHAAIVVINAKKNGISNRYKVTRMR